MISATGAFTSLAVAIERDAPCLFGDRLRLVPDDLVGLEQIEYGNPASAMWSRNSFERVPVHIRVFPYPDSEARRGTRLVRVRLHLAEPCPARRDWQLVSSLTDLRDGPRGREAPSFGAELARGAMRPAVCATVPQSDEAWREQPRRDGSLFWGLCPAHTGGYCND